MAKKSNMKFKLELYSIAGLPPAYNSLLPIYISTHPVKRATESFVNDLPKNRVQ